MNIFKRASQLRDQHPRKFTDYQDYVTWAKEEQRGKSQKRSPGKKKSAKKSGRKKSADKKLVPAKGIVHAKAVGALTFSQLRSRYKKSLEEELAWALLARDQGKNKTERKKKGKKVTELRRELNTIK